MKNFITFEGPKGSGKSTVIKMVERRNFITFEGPEGSGKSTIIKMVEEWLTNELHRECVVTREPGGIEISESIRSIILDKKNTNMDPLTEVLLYMASRRQHLIERVVPALDEGKIVLCDRFIDSSVAYQGTARGIGVETVNALNKLVIEEYKPDLTIYLDVEPEIGLNRIKENSRETNRLDLENLEFHKKVREGYLSIKEDRFIVIDANRSIEEVFEEVKKVLSLYLHDNMLSLNVIKTLMKLNYDEIDQVYRYVWHQHVYKDVLGYIQDTNPRFAFLNEDDARIIAARYVYDGEYDCERDYWTNIDSLCLEYIEEIKDERCELL